MFKHNIIEQIAAYWEELGLELGLVDYILNNILSNNDYYPNKTERCCYEMFTTLLRSEMPTWDELDDAINRLTSKKEMMLFVYGTLCMYLNV